MTFISYAQNFEDVMLWRALKHVERGFYIDVGAFSPDLDSVTRAFSERGWHGINIEPNPHYLAQLNARRPHDANLGIAVSDFDGEIELSVIEDTGLTTVDMSIAEGHANAGWGLSRISVPTQTLAQVWDGHVPEGQAVHFLKVDVEGHEAAVLRGADWSRHRPWIVVVEATLPTTQITSYLDWEEVLTQAGYAFVYWDGLNRYYLAKEHEDLADRFSAPPNVFDQFMLADHSTAAERVTELDAQVTTLRDSLEGTAAERVSFEQQLDDTLEKLGRVAADRARVEKQLHDAQRELDRVTTERGGFEEQLKTAWEDLARTEADRARIEQQLASAWYELSQVKLHWENLAERHGATLHEFEQAKAEWAGADRQLSMISHALASLVAEEASQRQALSGVTEEVRQSSRQINYIVNRSLLERLLFRPSGQPRKPLQALLFHPSGKPRRRFRRWVVHRDGRPRKAFRMWMTSPAYQGLPGAVAPMPVVPLPFPTLPPMAAEQNLSPRARYFRRRLEAVRARRTES